MIGKSWNNYFIAKTTDQRIGIIKCEILIASDAKHKEQSLKFICRHNDWHNKNLIQHKLNRVIDFNKSSVIFY
jgi:hypothetical protein